MQTSILATLEKRFVHDIKADGQELVNILDWGYVNPKTGMVRAQCDDSVAQGRCVSCNERSSSCVRDLHTLTKFLPIAALGVTICRLCTGFKAMSAIATRSSAPTVAVKPTLAYMAVVSDLTWTILAFAWLLSA